MVARPGEGEEEEEKEEPGGGGAVPAQGKRRAFSGSRSGPRVGRAEVTSPVFGVQRVSRRSLSQLGSSEVVYLACSRAVSVRSSGW